MIFCISEVLALCLFYILFHSSKFLFLLGRLATGLCFSLSLKRRHWQQQHQPDSLIVLCSVCVFLSTLLISALFCPFLSTTASGLLWCSVLISVGSKFNCFLPSLEEDLYHCQLSFQNCWAGIEFRDKCVLVPQSCLALCCPRDSSAPVFFVLSRQESWSGLPFPTPGNLTPGESTQVSYIASGFFTTRGKILIIHRTL